MNKQITLSKGGTDERVINIDDIAIPDLWHTAMWLKDHGQPFACDIVLLTWHLAHDFKRHIQES